MFYGVQSMEALDLPMPAILFAVFIDLLGFGIVVPILPFLTLKYGGDAFTGTGLISIYAFMTFVSGPFWGKLSDRIGRRPALVLTLIGSTLSYIVLAFSHNILMMYIARGLAGTMAGNIGIVMAATADMTEEENRGKAMGYISAAFALGFSLGPALGGILGVRGGEPNIFLPGLCAACLSATAALTAWKFMPESNKPLPTNLPQQPEATAPQAKPGWRDIFSSQGQTILLLMFIVSAAGQSIAFCITPYWTEAVLHWSGKEVGFLLMAVGLSIATMQALAVEPLFKRIGELGAIIIGAIVHISGSAIILLGPGTTTTALISFPMMMAGLTITYPALNSILSKRTEKSRQGVTMGVSHGLTSLGRVFGPVAAGAMFAVTAPNRPYYILAAAGVTVLVWALKELKNQV